MSGSSTESPSPAPKHHSSGRRDGTAATDTHLAPFIEADERYLDELGEGERSYEIAEMP